MTYEPRLITFFKNGLVKYFKPWLISNEAFPVISNAYAWRGVVKKREGFELIGSLPGGDSPVQGLKNWVNPASLAQTTVAFSLIKSYVYNTTTNLFQDISFLANPAGTAFSWQNSSNDYFWTSNYAASMWVTNNVDGDFIRYWTGANGVSTISGGWTNFRPTVNGTTQLTDTLIILPYKGRLVVLNTTEGANSFSSRARWSQIGSPYTSNTIATTISAIIPGMTTRVTVASVVGFTIGLPAGITNVIGSIASVLNFNQFTVLNIIGSDLILDVDTTGLLYTSDGNAQGPGTSVPPQPFVISIFGWRDDIPGRGGYVDADTSERIVSAEIVEDVLIVAFQRSSWRLRYTGNEILPFIWERINTQYGAESTYSNIPFDKNALFFSRYGWIAASPSDVNRIDENIPDDSFSVESQNTGLTGLSRIQGIRDYYRQFAYWTFPAIEDNVPNDLADQIYAYNYLDQSWSIFTPSVPIRVFGTFVQNYDMTWESQNMAVDIWANYVDAQDTWENFGSSENIQFPQILGGDSEGNVYTMFEFGQVKSSDDGENFGFQILTKCFNPYIEKGLNCRIGYVDIYCTTINGGQVTFNHYVNDQDTPVFTRILTLFPRSLVSISTIAIGAVTTITTGVVHNLVDQQQVLLTDIVGSVAELLNNNYFIATVTSPTTFTINQATSGNTYLSSGYVNNGLRSNYGAANYTRVYLGAIGHMHQFEFTLSQAQIDDPLNGTAQFELQGMVIWSRPTGMIRG